MRIFRWLKGSPRALAWMVGGVIAACARRKWPWA
jgi:hypothetical protein